ncbi:MAG: hypothetical protein EXR50_03995, partial [Dehalococcoidia bacterium]|nr:hypothetical protein [Dehalococcoidia bacterium]
MPHDSTSHLTQGALQKYNSRRAALGAIIRIAARTPSLTAASMIICALFLISLAAPLISDAASHPPEKIDLDHIFRQPSLGPAVWWLGSDEYGRSELIRLIYGGRVSLFFAALVAAINLTVGVSLGMIAGYYRGRVDDMVTWVL